MQSALQQEVVCKQQEVENSLAKQAKQQAELQVHTSLGVDDILLGQRSGRLLGLAVTCPVRRIVGCPAVECTGIALCAGAVWDHCQAARHVPAPQ